MLDNGKYSTYLKRISTLTIIFSFPEYTVDLMVYPPTSPSAALALGLKTDSHKLQLMKASFFLDDDYDGKSGN